MYRFPEQIWQPSYRHLRGRSCVVDLSWSCAVVRAWSGVRGRSQAVVREWSFVVVCGRAPSRPTLSSIPILIG